MRALIVERVGRPGVARLHTLPTPAIDDHEVLVRIEAAGLNPLDARLIAGGLKSVLPYRPPFGLGHDLAGVVQRVGAAVTGFAPGDAVYGRVRDGRIGTFADFIAADARDLAPKPAALSMVEAAAVPLAGLTAWQALVEYAALSPGERVLIHAGSGGVGTLAIQIARHIGAEVATTASGSSRAWLETLGAHHVIDYHDEAFERALSPQDVILHSLDRRVLTRSFHVLRRGGRLISISGPPDPAFARRHDLSIGLRGAIALASAGVRLAARRRGVDYRFLFMQASGRQLRELTALIDQGALRPVIDREISLTQVSRGLRHVESGRAKGKIVVRMT